MAAVETAASKSDNELIVVAQRDGTQDEPRWEDLYRVGTRAVLRKVGRNPQGVLEVLVQGLDRVQIVEELKEERFFRAKGRAEMTFVPVDRIEEVLAEALAAEPAGGRAGVPIRRGKVA